MLPCSLASPEPKAYFQTDLQADSGFLQHAAGRRSGLCLVPPRGPALSPRLRDGGGAGGPAPPPPGPQESNQESNRFWGPDRPGNIVSAVLGTGAGAPTGCPVRGQTRAHPRGNHLARLTLSRTDQTILGLLRRRNCRRYDDLRDTDGSARAVCFGHGKGTQTGGASLPVQFTD